METRRKDEDEGTVLPPQTRKKKRKKASSPDTITTPNSQSRKSKRGKGGGGAKGSKKPPAKPPAIKITDFTDDGLQALLTSTSDPDTREIYAQSIQKRIQTQAGKTGFEEVVRLANWGQRFRGEVLVGESTSEALGSRISTLGYGSLAAKHKNEIDQVITECKEDDENRKGRMLSHFFYRAFLKHIYGGFADTIANQAQDMASFKKKYDRIFLDTDIGVIKAKRTDGNTPETCVTSLLCPYINQAIHAVTEGHEDLPTWSSEFTLFGSGPATPATEKQKSATTKPKGAPRKGQQADEGPKQPRCDGLMVMADPLSGHSLRALVMMEAKIDNFDDNDDYQSKSNACDAFSRQPRGTDAWPLLVFRCTVNKENCTVKVLAVVPTKADAAQLVPLWTESQNSDSLYNAVVAAALAAKDFKKELEEQRRQLAFCATGQNVAIDRSNKQVFKSFFSTDRRNVNLDLIREHVDPDAREIKLGDEGSYVQMKDVGRALPDEVEVGKFVDVANSLAEAHKKGFCHGDIRIDNMMLQSGKLIDWDLAGKVNEHVYPVGLKQIVDGKRHPDVAAAIDDRKIGELQLSTEHDWYSLKKAMEAFKAKDESHQNGWEELIRNIEEAAERRKARVSYMLVLKPSMKVPPSDNFAKRATSSPK